MIFPVVFQKYAQLCLALVDELFELHVLCIKSEATMASCALCSPFITFKLCLVRNLAVLKLSVALLLGTLPSGQTGGLEEGKWLSVVVCKFFPVIGLFGHALDFVLFEELNAVLVVVDLLVVVLNQLSGAFHRILGPLALQGGATRRADSS